MSQDDWLDELLARWYELRAQGREATPEELCAGDPERLPAAREAILKIKRAEAMCDLPPPAPPGPPPVPGYAILEELGHGGFGVVYRALHVPLRRIVALKMVLFGQRATADQRARFWREAEAVARLQHPHIVQIYDFGEHENVPFLALEYVEGGNLAERLAGNPQSPELAARLVEPLARAIHYAHQQGIVHRDLKPANVLLGVRLATDGPRSHEKTTDPGRIENQEATAPDHGSEDEHRRSALDDVVLKVSDFGLAKRLDDQTGPTRSGQVFGTASYMSPEQAEGKNKEVDALTDVWAVGAIFYEMLTGRPPFKGETPLDTLDQVRTQEPVPPSRLQPRVSRDLETICLKCLQKEPRKRYGSAWELAEDLRRFQAREPIVARPVSRGERLWLWCRRNQWAAALLSVLAVAVLLGSGAGVLAIQQKLQAADERAHSAEALRLKREAEAEKEIFRQKGLQDQLKQQQSEALQWVEKAAVARADHFHQAEALYLAKALTFSDEPQLRTQQMEARQRSLVPVETTSRRLIVAGGLVYSSDSRFLVSADRASGRIRVWRMDDGTQFRVFSGHPPPPASKEYAVRGIVFRPDKLNEIISAGTDGIIQVWDVDSGAPVTRFPPAGGAPNQPFMALAIEPGAEPIAGRLILTGDSTGQLAWWTLNGLQKVKEVRAHSGPVKRVRFRPDGQQCASTGSDGVVRLWRRDGEFEGQIIPQSPKAGQPPIEMHELVYSPTGQEIAVTGGDSYIYVCDVARKQVIRRLPGHPAGFDGNRWTVVLAYLSNGRLLSGGLDGTLREWDTESGKQLRILGRHEAHVLGNPQLLGLAVRPDGMEIASSGSDMSIRIWDPRSGKALARLEGDVSTLNLSWFAIRTRPSAFCAAKDILITGTPLGADAFLHSWDTRTLRERRSYVGLAKLNETGNPERVSALAIHPDGSRFVSSEPNGDLVWWDTATGRQLFRTKQAHKPPDPHKLAKLVQGIDPVLRTHAEQGHLSWFAVSTLAYNHDGKLVASRGLDGMVRLWDAQTGERKAQWKDEDPEASRQELQGVRKTIQEGRQATLLLGGLSGLGHLAQDTLLFDPTDAYLITAGRDSVIRFWSMKTHKIVDRLRGHAQRVNGVGLSDDGKLLASGSEDGIVIVWDLKNRVPKHVSHVKPLITPDLSNPVINEDNVEVIESRAGEQWGVVRSLAFSPDQRWLAVVLQDGSVSLVDVDSGDVIYRGFGHEMDSLGKSVISAYFTREGELLTVGGDATVRHWDLPAWSVGRQGVLPLQGSLDVARSRKAGPVLFAPGRVIRWIPGTGRLQIEWGELDDPASAVGYGRHDGRIVLSTQRGRALVLDLKTGTSVAEFVGPPGGKRKPHALPSPEQLALNGGTGPVSAVAVQPTGALAASSWEDGSIDLWQLDDGQWVRTLRANAGRVTGLAFRPEGGQLAATYAEGELRLWNVSSGRVQFQGLGPKNASGLCYSVPDGRRLVQAGDGRRIMIWDPHNGRRLQTILGHRALALAAGTFRLGLIHTAACSPDGRWLATGSPDASVRLWDAKHGYELVAVLSTQTINSESSFQVRRVFPLQPPVLPGLPKSGDRGVISVTFSADSRHLVAALFDGSVRVYDLELILVSLHKTPEHLLTETEKVTGLRLQDERLVPIQQNQLLREGETLRKDYEQEYPEVLARVQRISMKAVNGHPAVARNDFEALLAEPGVPQLVGEMARDSLALAYLALGEFAKAEAEAKKVLAGNLNDAQARQNLAIAYAGQGRFKEAVELAEKTLAEAGLLPAAQKLTRRGLAAVYVEMGQFSRAEAESRKIVAMDRHDASSKLALAAILNVQGCFPEAEALFNEVIRDSDEPPLIQQLLQIGLRAPEMENQARAVRRALRKRARMGLATVYLAMNEPDKAEPLIQEALKSDRQTLRVLGAHTVGLMGSPRGQGPLLAASALIPARTDPNDLEARNNLASLYLQRNETDKAEALIQETLRRSAHNAIARSNLASVYVKRRQFDKAKEQYEEILHAPDSGLSVVGVRLALAQVYVETGEYREAATEIKKVLDIGKNNPWALAGQAALFAAQGKNLDEAAATFERLSKSQPNNMGLRVSLGWIRAKGGHAVEELAILGKPSMKEVIKRDPVFSDYLGDAYHLAGRPADARRLWKQALGLFPKTTAPNDHRKMAIERKLKALP